MTIGLVLVPLTGGKRDALSLAIAFAAAEPFAAHLRALFVRPDPTEALPFFGDEVAPAMAAEIVDAARESVDTASAAARAAFDAAAIAAGFEQVDNPVQGKTASFFEMNGHFADCIARAGGLSDLIVFGPLGENPRPGLSEAFETALLKTGKPVLLGVETQSPSFARVTIGWNGGMESAHAASAALPFLKTAKEVRIVTVENGAPDARTIDLEAYLRVHGIAAKTVHAGGQSRAVGDVLLEAARDADLLVIGGYGHSRLREWIAGGVTRRILSQATLPLLLTH